MARAWRIEYEGTLYHVLSRGNQREAIFADDEDRQVFLTTLSEMGECFEVDVCAYVDRRHVRAELLGGEQAGEPVQGKIGRRQGFGPGV